jgi:hypothetical protein
MQLMNTTAIWEGLSDVLDWATQTKERIVPNRRGNAVSALVSMEDLRLL